MIVIYFAQNLMLLLHIKQKNLFIVYEFRVPLPILRGKIAFPSSRKVFSCSPKFFDPSLWGKY